MGPDTPLPLPAEFSDVNDYVESLLQFATSSWLLQTLCGGVHILDFYTRSPDLYSTILPETWRSCFKNRDIMDILDLLMREDLSQFDSASGEITWRDGPPPPEDLLQYIKDVRRHLLGRDFFNQNGEQSTIARHIAVGMKVKKVHEVDHFARYVDRLTSDIAASGKREITHLVDFGSGQNYLGRALAAPPYSKHLIAVESKQHNIEGAKNMDVLAKLVPKPLVMRNKKEFRAGQKDSKKKKRRKQQSEFDRSSSLDREQSNGLDHQADGTAVSLVSGAGSDVVHRETSNGDTDGPSSDSALDLPLKDFDEEKCESCTPKSTETVTVAETSIADTTTNSLVPSTTTHNHTPEDTYNLQNGGATTKNLQIYTEGHGSVQYVEHIIKDGDLSPVVSQILDPSHVQAGNATHAPKEVEEPSYLTTIPKSTEPNLMVISLHSCGNLVHHGLRSMLLNPAVSAVAMVGCCYNLMTERLGPPTYKLPTLRPNHPRLIETSNACDPHGFPMSERLANYPLPHIPINDSDVDEQPKGVRLNITARMMGVQAPYNWGRADSDLFFTRHFYRSLLQRIFLDRGVVSAPSVDADAVSASGHSSRVNWTPPNGPGPGLSSDGTATPLTIGSLRRFAYKDFVSYVRAAIAKLVAPNSFCTIDPAFIEAKMDGLTDEEIKGYEEEYKERKKELAVMWSLMAFSAGVVEAVVVTDRWLWLKEQDCVDKAWVEPVFEYGLSPRNLVVVGIKK
jgi:hypothetical protein